MKVEGDFIVGSKSDVGIEGGDPTHRYLTGRNKYFEILLEFGSNSSNFQ